MTPTRWLTVIALAVTLISFALTRSRMDYARPSRDVRFTNQLNSSTTSPSLHVTRLSKQSSSVATIIEINESVSYPDPDQTELILPQALSTPSIAPRVLPASVLFRPIEIIEDASATLDTIDFELSSRSDPVGTSTRVTPELVEIDEENSQGPSLGNRIDELAPFCPTEMGRESVSRIKYIDKVLMHDNGVKKTPDPDLAEPILVIPLPVSLALDQASEASDDQRPWWDQKVVSPIRDGSSTKAIGLDEMILGALRYSPRVRAISDTPLIRETAIMESEGQFDWRAFMESRFTDTSDPVGSTLTTGGPARLVDQNWRYSAGMRRKTYGGGKFEISQRIGLEDSNSEFFVPARQANSRLSLNFTQPLLNGAGRAYNTSLILLAQIDTDAAQDEFSRQLQDHLLEVTRTYWELYLNRAVLLQKRKVHWQAVQILEELQSRRGVDALESQIVRARAAVETRQAEIVRGEMAIRNTESKLRVLVNDPDLLPNDRVELLPAESPLDQPIEINLTDSLATAMQHRPEIDQATQNVRAASVRLGISKKELQPVLDFVAETYASGLDGDYALGKSYGNQFSEGRPSYSVGLVFEIPLCNREARARYQRRQLELRQLAHELQNVIETTKAEVEIAVREVETSFREMQSKTRAVVATHEEVRYLQERWKLLPGEDQVASFLLEDLLDAQERLADAEFELASAQVTYTLSLSEHKRVMGTLLEAEQVEISRACEDGNPTLLLDKRN